jgi:hypothetical protein
MIGPPVPVQLMHRSFPSQSWKKFQNANRIKQYYLLGCSQAIHIILVRTHYPYLQNQRVSQATNWQAAGDKDSGSVACFTLQSWRLSQCVPLKHQWISTRLHIYTSQKWVLLAVFAVCTPNPIPREFILNLPFSTTSKHKIYMDYILGIHNWT